MQASSACIACKAALISFGWIEDTKVEGDRGQQVCLIRWSHGEERLLPFESALFVDLAGIAWKVLESMDISGHTHMLLFLVSTCFLFSAEVQSWFVQLVSMVASMVCH